MSPPRRTRSTEQRRGGGWGELNWLELIFDGVEPLFYLLRLIGHLVVVVLHAVFHL